MWRRSLYFGFGLAAKSVVLREGVAVTGVGVTEQLPAGTAVTIFGCSSYTEPPTLSVEIYKDASPGRPARSLPPPPAWYKVLIGGRAIAIKSNQIKRQATVILISIALRFA